MSHFGAISLALNYGACVRGVQRSAWIFSSLAGDLRSGHQVTKRSTISDPNSSFLYALIPPTVSDRFISNFQGVLSSPSCTTYHPFRRTPVYLRDIEISTY